MKISPTTLAARHADADRPLLVSLGDSYTSGMGSETTPTRGGNTIDMGVYGAAGPGSPWRSTRSAASLLARSHGFEHRDVSVGGATIDNVLHTGIGGEPAQITRVTADADVVLLTIGVNETKALDLVWPVRDGELTMEHPLARSVFARTGTVQAKVGQVLEEITRRAPNAQVRIAGYPYLFPVPGQPGGAAYLSAGERVIMQRAIDGVNAAIRAAATEAGPNVRYVDPNAAGSPFVARDGDGGRDLTSRSPDRWVNGDADMGTAALLVHPNARGYEYYAHLFAQSLR